MAGMGARMGQKQSLGRRICLHFKRYWRLHVLAFPCLLWLLLFKYAPMFGVTLAFQNFNVTKGFFGSEFVGLKNFQFLFSTTDAWRITRNTVLYNIAFITLNTSLSVVLAIVFNELYRKRFAKTLQTMLIMPNFLSMAVVAIVVYGFLSPRDGILNSVLELLGMQTRTWYTYKPIWPAVLIITYLWKNVGYSSIVYVASISGIPQEHYEAAVLDGATKWQQARYITIPFMRHIIAIMLILAIGGMFRGDMGLFYNVTQNNGALYEYTDIIDTYVYRALRTLGDTGMSTAAGLYQSVVGFVLILLSNFIVTRVDEESALF